jgi:hypothetical protein
VQRAVKWARRRWAFRGIGRSRSHRRGQGPDAARLVQGCAASALTELESFRLAAPSALWRASLSGWDRACFRGVRGERWPGGRRHARVAGRRGSWASNPVRKLLEPHDREQVATSAGKMEIPSEHHSAFRSSSR